MSPTRYMEWIEGFISECTARRRATAVRWLGWLILALPCVHAGDWPTYMGDTARGGVSSARLDLPLSPLWSIAPAAVARRAWPAPPFEFAKLDFDDATHVAMVGDSVYFGSSVDYGIHAVAAATGERRWTVFTGGPVRLAPTVADGRVYAGSDDGWVYCLDAADGRVIWRVQPFPGDRQRMIGAGTIISQHPVRTGILVDDGVAYCGAGVFPWVGTRLFAFDAVTGERRWASPQPSRDHRFPHPIPQGYLVSQPTVHIPKSDRLLQAALEAPIDDPMVDIVDRLGQPRAVGLKTLFVPRGRAVPQIFCRIDGAFRASPTQERGGLLSGSYGIRIGDRYYSGSQDILYGFNAIDGSGRVAWEDTSQLIATEDTIFRLAGPVGRRGWRLTVRPRNPVVALNRALISEAAGTVSIPREAIRWTYTGDGLRRMIVAGDHLVVGGSNHVTAVDIVTGKAAWTAPVPGVVHGLAVGRGRLAVSLADGSIHVFGSDTGRDTATVKPGDAGLPPVNETFLTIAHAMIQDTGRQRGFALVAAGANNLDWARALAASSELRIHVWETHARRAAEYREQLFQAGLYGSRIVIDTVSPETADRLPYPPYFANLILVADSPAGFAPPPPSDELLRVLRPAGGRLYNKADTVDATAAWHAAGMTQTVWPPDVRGWARWERSPLPGAGDWTHQFADAGNTGSSDDDRVKGRSFDVLWYGDPGPDRMQDRHTATQAPLVIDGLVYAQGRAPNPPDASPLIMCFDAYNGTLYWEREIAGAERLEIGGDCGNLAASTAGLFVAVNDTCLQLDPASGTTLARYAVPPRDDRPAAEWAFVAVVGDRLVGSASSAYRFSDELFAYDLATGQLAWRHPAPVTRNATIAIDGGRVFFVEHRGEAVRPPVILKRAERLAQDAARRRSGAPPPSTPTRPPDDNRRTVVALDLQTGKPAWAVDVDLTGCGSWGGSLSAAAKHGLVAFFGNYNAYGRPKGDEADRRVLTLSATDGAVVWNRPFGNFVRPLLMRDMIVARPQAFHLASGEPVHIDGKPWRQNRLGACGQMTASAHMLFYRIGHSVLLDFEAGGPRAFIGTRPGCYINMIPAGGLLVQVEASSGCSCDVATLQSTVVLAPSLNR